MELSEVIAELRARNEPVPKPLRLPTDAEIDEAERQLGVTFPPDYRRYLREASDVVVGTLEPGVVIPNAGHLDLVAVARSGWAFGVQPAWLPIAGEDGDYFCLDGDEVRYWSHNGVVDESWPDLATWIHEVWLGERG